MTSKALTHHTTQARIAELEAEVARLKVDAERYRWLRYRVYVYDRRYFNVCMPSGISKINDAMKAETDAAIDTALAASKGA